MKTTTILLIFLYACSPKEARKAAYQINPINDEVAVPKEVKVPEMETELELEMSGQYIATFETLNKIVSEEVFGALTLSREEDEFVGDVRFSGGALTASIMHIQNVHLGRRCPTLEDDLNQDGFIDAIEGETVFGKVLIPLDGDLNAQHLGLGTFPVADEYGSYVYSRVASFERFIKDLKEDDINSDDYLIKLNYEDKLKLIGRVVVIQGISPEAQLPHTVGSNSRFQNFQNLPIACGIIRPIHSVPGRIDRDEPKLPSNSDTFGGPAGEEDGTIIIPPTF